MDSLEFFENSPETLRARNAYQLASKYTKIPKALEAQCAELRRSEVKLALTEYYNSVRETGKIHFVGFGLIFFVTNALIKWPNINALNQINRFKIFPLFLSFTLIRMTFLKKVKLDYERYAHIIEPLFDDPEVKRTSETPVTFYKMNLYREMYEKQAAKLEDQNNES